MMGVGTPLRLDSEMMRASALVRSCLIVLSMALRRYPFGRRFLIIMPSLSSIVASAPMAKNMGKEIVEIVDKCVVWSQFMSAKEFINDVCGIDGIDTVKGIRF